MLRKLININIMHKEVFVSEITKNLPYICECINYASALWVTAIY